MRIETMKRIDYWAGGFGCFLLDIFDRLRRLFFPRRPIGEVRTILITKYFGMGSVILAAPFVQAVRRRFPGARLVFLGFEENRAIAGMLGLFEEVLSIRSHSLVRLGLDTLRALRRLWRLRVDLVFDLEFFTRYSAVMAYLSGARWRVGFWSRIAWRGGLATHPVYYNHTRHISRIFLAMAEAAGASLEPEPPLPQIAPDPEAWREAGAALRRAGLNPEKPFLLVNPNASELCVERRWMPERFAGVVRALLQENPDLQAIYIGSSGERAYTETSAAWVGSRERLAVLAGAVDLGGLLELLRRAKLFLTNDSGPLHLATLAGTPTVALFGPETPTLYGPLGANQRVFYAGVYCSPCLNVFNSKTAPCNGNNICMQAFGTEEVLQACREALR